MAEFADIGRLSDDDMEKLLRAVDQSDVVVALRGAGADERDLVLRNMPAEGRESMEEELESPAETTHELIAAAQSTVAAKLSQLVAGGNVTLPPAASAPTNSDRPATTSAPGEVESIEDNRNPYITGNPLKANDPFYGREDNFAYVKQRLITEREGIILLFVGGRRSGKTSIMFQILDGRLGEEFLPVFIDMQLMAGIEGDSDFLERMAHLTIEAVQDERIIADYYDFSVNPIIVFDRLLGDIEQAFPSKRLIFLVDEAEILRDRVESEQIRSAVLAYMSSALESRRVSFLFTGSQGLAVGEGAEWRRLIGKSDSQEITFLSPDDTMRLAQEPVRGRVFYEEGTLDSIYKLAYGHPFYTQVICQNIFDYLAGEGRNTLTMADLDEVVRTIVNNPPPQLVYDWDQYSEQEQLTLSLLSEVCEEAHVPVGVAALTEAKQENRYPIELREDAMNVALDGLDDRKVLERAEDGGYHFLVDIMRLWIRRNRSVWRLVEETEPEKGRGTGWIAAAVVGLVIVVGAGALIMREPDPVVTPRELPLALTTGELWIAQQYSTDATLLIDGVVNEGTTPTMIEKLTPGQHVVEIRQEGYHAVVETMVVAAGKKDTLDKKLIRRRGLLTVLTPVGAKVQMIGSDFDTTVTGASDLELPTGDYELVASKAGFRQATRSMLIDDARPHTVKFELVSDVGDLQVSTTPSGAQVLIDGEFVGTSPVTLPVSVGQHQISLIKDEHVSVERRMSVRFGEVTTLDTNLELQPASFDLKTVPPEVAVTVDGILRGETPVLLDLSPRQLHRIQLFLEGYDEETIECELSPGQDTTATLTLNQQFGDVRITWPLTGTLYVDGELEKSGPLGQIELSVGLHELSIEGEGEVKTIRIFKDSTVKHTWKK